MTTQFQTTTFPNHWTMVTGLYAESHGIIADNFFDPKTETQFVGTNWNNKPHFWGGEPLWITNQKNGGKTACEFWVGSDVQNRTPTYYDKFNSSKVQLLKTKNTQTKLRTFFYCSPTTIESMISSTGLARKT